MERLEWLSKVTDMTARQKLWWLFELEIWLTDGFVDMYSSTLGITSESILIRKVSLSSFITFYSQKKKQECVISTVSVSTVLDSNNWNHDSRGPITFAIATMAMTWSSITSENARRATSTNAPHFTICKKKKDTRWKVHLVNSHLEKCLMRSFQSF